MVPVTVNLTRSKKKEDFGLVLGYQLYVREIVPNRYVVVMVVIDALVKT